MARKLTGARAKTVRAFNAYIDLMDAADWIRDEMNRQLDSWDLTVTQFRVLERIYRHGPQYQQAISHTFRCSKQNVRYVIEDLVSSGCVRRVHSSLPPVRLRDPSAGAERVRRLGRKRAEQARRRGAEDRRGRRIILLRLTPEGRNLIAHVFPKHAKVVKSHMKVLDGREQATLSRLCRKLREGDIIKFVREITMDRDEDI